MLLTASAYLWCGCLHLLIVASSCSAPSPPKVLNVRIANKVPLENVESQRTLTLECSADGNPMPSLRWTINGTKSIPLDGQDVRFEDNKARLIIYQVRRSRDSGAYRCVAENQLGTVFGELQVDIGVAGQFAAGSEIYDPERTVKVVEGAKAVINCPDHTEGTGELYLWGDYPLKRSPIFLNPGDSSPRAFIANDGALVFSYITDDDIAMLNQMKGISCILYEAAVPIQSVKIKVEKVGSSSTLFPPELVKFMKPRMIATIDEEFSVDCGATGRPLPDINWFKNGMKIEEDSKIRFGRTHKLRLTISKVNEEDRGVYRCVANNSQGTALKEGRLEIHIPPSFVPPVMPDVSKPLLWESFSLECKTKGNPRPAIEWYHNNTILAARPGLQISDERIQFSRVEFSDTGMYLCVARNYLKVAVAVAYVQVEGIAPSFVQRMLEPTYLFKRQDNALVCNATGAPLPTISWYRNGEPLGVEGEGPMFATSDGVLTFTNSSVAQEGRYKCAARNVKGIAESEVQVRIVEKTVITHPPENLVSREHDAFAAFFCDAEYEADSLDFGFQWFKDGQEIVSSESVYVEKRISGPSRILYLQDLQVNYAGAYTCRVYSKEKTSPRIVSEDQKSASLLIIAAPGPVPGLNITGDCGSFDADLSWELPASAGVDVSYYLVEYATYESAEASAWFLYNPESPRVVSPTRTVKLRRGLLAPGADLMFRVKAVTLVDGDELIGQDSQPTAIGQCVTPPAAPLLNPGNVSVAELLNPGELTVKWDKILKIHQGGRDFQYIVGYRKKGDAAVTEVIIRNPNVVSYTVPNTGYYEEYEIFVRTANEAGLGPEPKSVLAFSGRNKPTTTPANLRAIEVRANSVELAWGKVEDADKYRVYVWEATVSDRRRRDVSKRARRVDVRGHVGGNVTGLAPRTGHKVTVAAVNNGGIGPQSKEVYFTTLDGVPSVPVDVQLTVMADKLKLRWSPPVSGHQSIVTYNLSWYKTKNPADNPGTLAVPGTAKEAFIVSNLEQLTYYNVELAALSDLGAGKAWSRSRVVVGHPDKPGQPLPPLLEATTNSSVNVTFILAEKYYGGMPSKFVVYYQISGDTQPPLESDAAYPFRSWLVVEGLSQRQYDFWVEAVNEQGTSDRSGVSTGAPLATFVVESTSLPRAAPRAFYRSWWFLIVVVCLVSLTMLAIVVYLILQRRGGKYPVGKRESNRADDQPLTDYANKPCEDVNGRQVKSKDPPRSIIPNALRPSSRYRDDDEHLDHDDDRDSLDDYAEDANFDDNASFIGQYGDDRKKNGALTVV